MSNLYIEELSILFDSYNESIERESKLFDRYKKIIDTNGLILFGAGGFGRRTLNGLRQVGIEVICFTDNNELLWNEKVEDKIVLAPSEALKKYPEALYMVTIWSDIIGHPVPEIREIFKANNSDNIPISFFSLYWKYPETFLPYFGLDLPHKTVTNLDSINRVFSLFVDEISKREYLAQIRWRIWFDYENLSFPDSQKQYFPLDILKISFNEVFVDCGAFNGDTLTNFLKINDNKFSQYIAFEPDPLNYLKLKKSISDLDTSLQQRILSFELALSNESKVIKFDAKGSLQSSENLDGNIEVKCVSLDEKFYENKPTFIKIDAEGAEPEIIDGAIKIIKDYSPVLAVSVYHKFDHLWTLPLKISEITPNYKYFLRPHCKACWDLVLYAIPEDRTLIV